VVLAPAQLESVHKLLLGRAAPRIFLRLNWCAKISSMEDAGGNEESEFLNMIDVSELSKAGADGGVAVFPLGFSEEMEFRCFKEIANTSHAARSAGMPLLVDAHFGKEIKEKNRLDAAELAVMMSTEAGADGVFVPCEKEREKKLWKKLQFARIPVFLKIPGHAAPDAQLPKVLRTALWDVASQDGSRR